MGSRASASAMPMVFMCMLELSRFLRAYLRDSYWARAVSGPTPEWNVRGSVTRRSPAGCRPIRKEGRSAAALVQIAHPTGFSSLQAFDAHRRYTFEVGDRLVDHIDPVDGPLPAPQVQRRSVSALPEEMAGWEIIGLPVGVDDPYAAQLDVRTAGVQPDRLEAPFAAADAHRVVVLAEQGNLLAAELD